MTFSDIEKLLNLLDKPSIFIDAQKKAFAINKEKRYFNEKKLKYELRYEWWKRALHSYKENGIGWITNLYTILSYRYVIIKKFWKRKEKWK